MDTAVLNTGSAVLLITDKKQNFYSILILYFYIILQYKTSLTEILWNVIERVFLVNLKSVIIIQGCDRDLNSPFVINLKSYLGVH